MSEPLREPAPIELGTETNWRMIALGAGLGAGVLTALVAFALFAWPQDRPRPGRPAAPPAVAEVRQKPAAPEPPRRTTLPRRVEIAELRPMSAEPARTVAQAEPARPAPRPTPVAVRTPAPAAPPATSVEPEPVVASTPEPAPPAFKRIRPSSEVELRFRLDAHVKEIDLDPKGDVAKKIVEEARQAKSPDSNQLPAKQPVLDVIASRTDLQGLPVRKGTECLLSPAVAAATARIGPEMSRMFARQSQRAEPVFSEIEHEQLRSGALVKYLERQKNWKEEAAVSCLVQILQVQGGSVRDQLVGMLASVKGEKASQALAQRAVFDVSPFVREAAIKALASRPAAEFRPVLLAALRHPLPFAADHAAEALVALGDLDALPDLVPLLDQPDPAAPARDAKGKLTVREVVKVNHLSNCLLCHAPSSSAKDPVRGLVPEKGKSLEPSYHEARSGSFVRVDVVYLKQDFSLMQPVAKAHPWPAYQRYDYLVRTRELTAEEAAALPARKDADDNLSYPQRQAVLWALRELTGLDAGQRSDEWRSLLSWVSGLDL
jgi:hypothetical protein